MAAAADYQRALALIQEGQPEEAECTLHRLLRRDPLNPDALNDLGALAYGRGELTRALAFFEFALFLRPSSNESRDNAEAVRIDLLQGAVAKRESLITDPKVTVALPIRNREIETIRLLHSLRCQTFQNIDLIISDDGDSSLEGVIRVFFPDLKFRYLVGPKRGLAENRDLLMRNSHTDLIFMCHDDVVLHPRCLEYLVGSISADPALGMVSAIWPNSQGEVETVDVRNMGRNAEFRPDVSDLNRCSMVLWTNGSGIYRSFHEPDQILEAACLEGQCFVFRRSAICQVGGFAEGLSKTSFREAADVSGRLYNAGRRLCIDTRAYAPHLPGSTERSIDWNRDKIRDGILFLRRLNMWRERERQVLLVKHVPDRHRVTVLGDGDPERELAGVLRQNLGCSFNISISGVRDLPTSDWYLAFKNDVVERLPEDILKRTVLLCTSDEQFLDAKAHLASRLAAVSAPSAARMSRRSGNLFFCPVHIATGAFFRDSTELNNRLLCVSGEHIPEWFKFECASRGFEYVHLRPEMCAKDRCAIYQRSLALINFENAGFRAVLEAMASGAAVVSIPAPEIAELIVDGFNGMLVEDEEQVWSKLPSTENAYELGRQARLTIEQLNLSYLFVQAVQAIFLELIRDREYGPVVVEPEDPREVDTTLRLRVGTPCNLELTGATGPKVLEKYIDKVEGRFVYLRDDFLAVTSRQEMFDQALRLLYSLPPYFLHIGGVGDALLLLSTFYDLNPRQNILSISGSLESSRAFFDVFPELQQIYLLSMPKMPSVLRFLRQLQFVVPTCLGRGATPKADHAEEWRTTLNIFSHYGIVEHPLWVKRFEREREQHPQVIVAPRGSLLEMTSGKRNIIDPRYWITILKGLEERGIRPIVIGTPHERSEFPCLHGAIDRRSFSFREQMELIASSDALVGADSWGKSFAALAGIPTFVFPPTVYGEHKQFEDASSHVFLKSWSDIKCVFTTEQLFAEFDMRCSARRTPRVSAFPRPSFGLSLP